MCRFAALAMVLLASVGTMTQAQDSVPAEVGALAEETAPDAAPRAAATDAEAPLTPRELLELYQIPAAQLDGLQDGASILSNAEEADLLLRVLYRFPEIPRLVLEDWAKQNAAGGGLDWSLLATEPTKHRGKVFKLAGRVIGVSENKLDDAVVKRYQLPKFYRVRMQLAGSTRIADVYAHRIPKDWENLEQAGMQAGAVAMFLKRGDSSDPAGPLVFVTDRVAWYTDSLLGDLGVDGGLFDDVANNRAIGKGDRELFYQMLHAAGIAQTNELARYAEREIVIHGRNLLEERRAMRQQLEQMQAALDGDESRLKQLLDPEPTQLKADILALQRELRLMELRIARAKQNQHELFPLLENPSGFEGKLLMFRGVARRITKVRVEDPDIVARFDIDHYFQIDATVELEFNVTLKDAKEGESSREMWSFPVTFCARRLPPGMPTGENINEEVRLTGFFFKKWSYELEKQEGQQKAERFSAPMLIGREPIWIRPPAGQENPYNGLIAGGLFLIALLGVWLGVWRLGRGDKKFKKETIARTYALREGESLDELEVEETGGPDFSYLQAEEELIAEEPPASAGERPEPVDEEDRASTPSQSVRGAGL